MSNGSILWEGPSRINGDTIRVLVTGLNRPSQNPKTGPIPQVSYLPNMHALDALKSGTIESVCGDCPLYPRGAELFGAPAVGRTCYVNLAPIGNATRDIAAGKYPRRALQRRRGAIRLGSFGDPAAVPVEVNRQILSRVEKWTGFTRRWRHLGAAAPEREFLMASTLSPAEAAEAQALGWRTYRVLLPNEAPAANEIMCPYYTKEITCERCGLCCGTARNAKNITAPAHAPGREETFAALRSWMDNRESALVQISG